MTEIAKPKRHTRWAILGASLFVIILLGALGAFQFVLKPKMIARFFASNQQSAITVSTTTATLKGWRPTINAIGTIVAVRGVDITAETDGNVAEIFFESGDDVAQGVPLLRLNDEVEKAELAQSLAELTQANLDLERSRSLAIRGNASQSTLDSAQAKRDSASANVDRTRALIKQKNVRAPFAGRLGVRQVNLGEYLALGQEIVTLQALDTLYVNFPLPEQALAVLKVGQKLNIKVDAYPDQVFSGEINALDAKVEASTRNVLVQATLANPDHALVPGMFADIALYHGPDEPRITVPETAISFSLYGNFVYVAKPEEGGELYDAERRSVQLGDKLNGEVVIESGVEAGEEVISAGQLKLYPGAVIRIDNSHPLLPQSPRSKF